jgi:hypothetical protein
MEPFIWFVLMARWMEQTSIESSSAEFSITIAFRSHLIARQVNLELIIAHQSVINCERVLIGLLLFSTDRHRKT